MILFKEIYNKAITLFDDPDIQRAYFEDTVRWQKIMYPYLREGINLFTNPTKVSFLLNDQEDPFGKIEIFDGNGTNEYHLSTVPAENCDFSCLIDGKNDQLATFNRETNSIIFSRNVEIGETCLVEWYYGGKFNSDFSSAKSPHVSENVIISRVKEIMARALVLSWAENEKNFALDIRNILTDTDFRLYSPANSIRAKTEWVKQLRYDFDSMQSKLAWDLYARKYTGGNYYV